MKKERNYKPIAIFVAIFIYSVNKYLPYEVQLIMPLLVGISGLVYGVYMKSKGKIPKYETFLCIISGIGCILISAAVYAGGTLHNYNYMDLMFICVIILFDILFIARIIDLHKNGTRQEFIKIRNIAISFIIGSTLVIGILLYPF